MSSQKHEQQQERQRHRQSQQQGKGKTCTPSVAAMLAQVVSGAGFFLHSRIVALLADGLCGSRLRSAAYEMVLMPLALAWSWWLVGVSVDDYYYYFAEAELVDVIAAVTLPTLSVLPAPLAMTLAMLRPPCQALQVLGLFRRHGNGAAARGSLHGLLLLLCTSRVASWACCC
jgi:hypothetical protein